MYRPKKTWVRRARVCRARMHAEERRVRRRVRRRMCQRAVGRAGGRGEMLQPQCVRARARPVQQRSTPLTHMLVACSEPAGCPRGRGRAACRAVHAAAVQAEVQDGFLKRLDTTQVDKSVKLAQKAQAIDRARSKTMKVRHRVRLPLSSSASRGGRGRRGCAGGQAGSGRGAVAGRQGPRAPTRPWRRARGAHTLHCAPAR